MSGAPGCVQSDGAGREAPVEGGLRPRRASISRDKRQTHSKHGTSRKRIVPARRRISTSIGRVSCSSHYFPLPHAKVEVKIAVPYKELQVHQLLCHLLCKA